MIIYNMYLKPSAIYLIIRPATAIDLVINYDCIDKYEGYVYGDSIHNLLAISGQGILIIDLILVKTYNIVFTDNSGK